MLDPTSRVAIVLASAGRPLLLADALLDCAAQSDVSFHGVVSVPDEESLPIDRALLDGWTVLSGTRGAAAQRNAGLDFLEGKVDVVFFFDDDIVLRSDYMSIALEFLAAHENVVGLTGRVLADGKRTGEIEKQISSAIIAQSWLVPPTNSWKQTRELYGANLVARVSKAPGHRFDSRLPLYSWLEDHDFARRLMVHGRLAHVEDCVLVHRAASTGGRANHHRLGYSQVMNPAYLHRKGSFPLWLTLQQIARPLLKNLLCSTTGSEVQWRRKRFYGNCLALFDVIRGRRSPEKIVDL